ncbi:MAG: hypothetical protein JWM13_1940 [Arthrobacter sp.]|nr:hypothetical protein [Arthrobacter sp.]
MRDVMVERAKPVAADSSERVRGLPSLSIWKSSLAPNPGACFKTFVLGDRPSPSVKVRVKVINALYC